MRFWDTSALLPLILAEPSSDEVRRRRDEDPDLYVWWGSRVEAASAVARLAREGRIAAAALAEARQDLADLWEEISEVAPTDDLRTRAERCLAVHPLRAADALQLGAALIWSAERPLGQSFVSLDARLREAAGKEGFTVLP